MPLHLIKLCVGAESIRDHEDWIKLRLAQKKAAGEPVEQTHRTRMVPKRVEIGRASCRERVYSNV